MIALMSFRLIVWEYTCVGVCVRVEFAYEHVYASVEIGMQVCEGWVLKGHSDDSDFPL